MCKDVLLNLVNQRDTPIRLVKHLVHFQDVIDETDDVGNTSLIWAARNDKPAVLKILIYSDADIHHVDKSSYKDTALSWAVFKGNVECALILLKHGANINQQTCVYGNSLLMWAHKQDNYELFLILVHRGSNMRLVNRNHLDIYELCDFSFVYDRIVKRYRGIVHDILYKVFLNLPIEMYLIQYIMDFY